MQKDRLKDIAALVILGVLVGAILTGYVMLWFAEPLAAGSLTAVFGIVGLVLGGIWAAERLFGP